MISLKRRLVNPKADKRGVGIPVSVMIPLIQSLAVETSADNCAKENPFSAHRSPNRIAQATRLLPWNEVEARSVIIILDSLTADGLQ